MNLRLLSTLAAFVFSTALLASYSVAQSSRPAASESAYGGATVAEIIARVNDQIITRADYDRAMAEMDADGRQRGVSRQQISESHKDLLRSLIDQQLWLSKGKELGINGQTELIKRLDEIRKQYHLETMEDLEKAAKEQGVSFEDYKANIRNGIITQEVMRQELGRKIQFTPGEAQRYFEEHKQEYVQPESVTLSEILISTGTPAPSVTDQNGAQEPDAAKLAAAKAKADDIEAKLRAGGDFAQLARNFSDGSTAPQGGDIGQYQRDKLAKVLEDKTFALKAGEFTEPIRTKQGYIILKVLQHIPGGVPAYKDVAAQVEENFFMARMEPAMRAYLTTMREQAYIDIKPAYTDTGASLRQTKPVYSAYVPPTPKKKKKVERTRFRESTRSFRQKTTQPAASADTATATPATAEPAKKKGKKKDASADLASMKPGKREKIRFGQAPSKTLPSAPETQTEDAGAGTAPASASSEPENPLEPAAKPVEKSRFSARAKVAKKPKAKGPKVDSMAPAAADSAEVADRQTQAGPLGLAGDTSKKKKKKATTTGDKTRITERKKSDTPAEPTGDAPLAPAQTPAPAPQEPAPTPQQ